MKVSNISIKNFKGIKELTLDLNREPANKVFTLVGLNESGKTSILEAIDVVHNGIRIGRRHELIPKGEKIDFNDSIDISISYSWTNEDNDLLFKFIKSLGYNSINKIEKHTVTKTYKFINSEPVSEQGITNIWNILITVTKINNDEKLTLKDKDSDWHKIIEFIRDQLMPTIIYYPDFLFDFPERIYIDSPDNYNYEEKKYYAIIQDILTYIRPSLTVERHLVERMKNSNRNNDEALEITLGQMGAAVTRVVFSAWGRIFAKGNKEIIIARGKTVDDDGSERYYLEFKVREGPVSFYINERSLGFRWFFAFLVFTEFRKHRASDAGETLFLLDEPASNLHSTAQIKLLTTFSDLVSKSTLIYTTHSNYLINPNWLSGAYIIRNKALDYQDEFSFETAQTDIEAVPYRQFIAQHPTQVDYFQPILDALEHRPGLLEKIPSLFITEGKNDYYTFKYINELYLESRYNNLNMYPGTGADTHIGIMSMYLAWGREFVLLLDADAKGVKAKDKYINSLGTDVQNKVYTLKDIDSSWSGKTTEDLFTGKELFEITKKFDEQAKNYEKSKFNTAIQTLYFHKEKIDISEETLHRFECLFQFISNELAH